MQHKAACRKGKFPGSIANVAMRGNITSTRQDTILQKTHLKVLVGLFVYFLPRPVILFFLTEFIFSINMEDFYLRESYPAKQDAGPKDWLPCACLVCTGVPNVWVKTQQWITIAQNLTGDCSEHISALEVLE